MSSVLMSIQTWITKGDDLLQKFQEFSEKKGLFLFSENFDQLFTFHFKIIFKLSFIQYYAKA